MQIQDGDKGHLATLPLVTSETLVGDVLSKMKQFWHCAAVVARKDGTYAVVTADEISIALGAAEGKKAQGTRVGELYPDRESIQFADFGVIGQVMHGLTESRGGHRDYRIVAIGHNAVTVLAPTANYWQKLKAK